MKTQAFSKFFALVRELMYALWKEFFQHELILGFNCQLAPKDCHGVAWFESADGKSVLSETFTVNRPWDLHKPTERILKSLYRQIQAMGHKPLRLELKVNGMWRVYEVGDNIPVFEQAL